MNKTNHLRSSFSQEEIDVLSSKKSEMQVLQDYNKMFPSKKINSLQTFSRWIKGAREVKEAQLQRAKPESTRTTLWVSGKTADAIKGSKNKTETVDEYLQNALSKRAAPAFVDDSLFVKDYNLRVETLQVLKEMLNELMKTKDVVIGIDNRFVEIRDAVRERQKP